MKKSLFLIFVISTLFLIGTTPVMATSFSFGDGSIYWPTWGNGTSDDLDDDIGNDPKLTGGQYYLDASGNLTQVDFTFSYANAAIITPGDLFIDVGADNTWDYVVAPSGDGVHATLYTLGLALSSIKGDNDSRYVMSSSGSNFREDHPVKYVAGRDTTSSAYYSTFTSSPVSFSGFSIGLNNDAFIIGFVANTCANDVIFEKASVPEPGPMLLFGAFMIGMATIGKKKYFKK